MRLKKFMPVLIILVAIITTVAISPVCAFADTNDITADEITGIDLGDYNVELTYKRYILQTSGIEMAFEVVFDRNYVATNFGASGQNQIQDVLTEISLIVKNLGYIITLDTENNSFVGSMSFDSITDYYIAIDEDGYGTYQDTSNTKKSFLYVQSDSSTKTVFDGIEESEGLLQNFLQNFYNLGIDRENILLSYEYGTPYKIISTDADSKTYLVGKHIYVHKFDMNMDNSDREIHLSQKSPNIVGWYLTALGIALVIAGMVTLVYIVRKKRKEK
ncbi:MAG: hypothetical protein WCR54_06950 [Clostridia bacterium]